ncbi:MAG: FAD-dependent monooxygenase [Cumulibacter sp.]
MAMITIVGGGVAGLALASTISPDAHTVTLIERNPGYGRVPTAFGIWPFALDALDRIGLADELRADGLMLTNGVITADAAGHPVTMTRREADMWLITRPALLKLLDHAVPDSVVRENRQVNDPAELCADLVVAADGARSVVRSRMWGDTPRDTGVVAIRGILTTAPEMPPDQMREFWGGGKLFGVGPNRFPDGMGTNWYASTRRGEESPTDALRWARAAYADFPDLVRATLDAADPDTTVVNAILESRRPRSVVRGRYVLIGDAAHAMSPNLGRGACEALVDAIVLGEALNEHGMAGVREYEQKRRRAGQRTRAAASMARRVALSRRASRVLVRLGPN